uniref:Uncharacterized protein n=1 Tax=Anguilla anguilla TaxID=7936 RepID=A0A0E9U0D4_ANGAN
MCRFHINARHPEIKNF